MHSLPLLLFVFGLTASLPQLSLPDLELAERNHSEAAGCAASLRVFILSTVKQIIKAECKKKKKRCDSSDSTLEGLTCGAFAST